VAGPIGSVISSGHATLHELQSVYGTEDMYDMLEIIVVNNHNRQLMDKINADRN
jgi:hypothetical protein